MTKTIFAAVWDADAIAPISQLHQALKIMRKCQDSILAYPYDGTFWFVSDFFSELFCKELKLKILKDYPQNKSLMNGFNSVGGAFVVSVENYKKIGWENEHFLGWGPEDLERYKRTEILWHKPYRVNGALFHLWHTRGINSGDFNHELALSTKKEYAKVCAMTKLQLCDYIKSWKWIK